MKQCAILQPTHKDQNGTYYPKPNKSEIKIKSKDGKITTTIKI